MKRIAHKYNMQCTKQVQHFAQLSSVSFFTYVIQAWQFERGICSHNNNSTGIVTMLCNFVDALPCH